MQHTYTGPRYTATRLVYLCTVILGLYCIISAFVPGGKGKKYDFEHDYTGLTPVQVLGKKIFFDKQLSDSAGLSCAGCHSASAGFADPRHRVFSEGALSGSFMNRNAPTVAYLALIPKLHYDTADEAYVGGLFWDGSANTLEEQAMKPLMNHLEMNNRGCNDVVCKLKKAEYTKMFTQVFGKDAFADTTKALHYAMKAVAEFERSKQLNAFTSKYDFYLAGKVKLSDQEMRGLKLFNDTARAQCVSCHPSGTDNPYGVALFTDFTYDNIGLPHNPATHTTSPDVGLGMFLNKPDYFGQFKVPTLRNVELTAPYFHNGIFDKLEDAVRFYSERDVPGKFRIPEVTKNMNKEELGNLKLTDDEIKDIVAFLKTLTDGYEVK